MKYSSADFIEKSKFEDFWRFLVSKTIFHMIFAPSMDFLCDIELQTPIFDEKNWWEKEIYDSIHSSGSLRIS